MHDHKFVMHITAFPFCAGVYIGSVSSAIVMLLMQNRWTSVQISRAVYSSYLFYFFNVFIFTRSHFVTTLLSSHQHGNGLERDCHTTVRKKQQLPEKIDQLGEHSFVETLKIFFWGKYIPIPET